MLEGPVLETVFCIHHSWSALANLTYIKATYDICDMQPIPPISSYDVDVEIRPLKISKTVCLCMFFYRFGFIMFLFWPLICTLCCWQLDWVGRPVPDAWVRLGCHMIHMALADFVCSLHSQPYTFAVAVGLSFALVLG